MESQILEVLTGAALPLSARDISAALGFVYSDVYMFLVNMQERGLVEYVSGRFAGWKLPDKES